MQSIQPQSQGRPRFFFSSPHQMIKKKKNLWKLRSVFLEQFNELFKKPLDPEVLGSEVITMAAGALKTL